MSGRNLQIHAPLGEARESPGGGRQRPLGGRAPGRGDRGGQAGSQVAVMAAGSVVEPGRVGNGGETTGKARVWALSCICGSPKAWRVLGSGVRAGFEF